MQDTELFLSVAEIAGVFVGFGALIALRSGLAARPAEVMFVSMVVLGGVQVVVAALVPVVIGRFDVPDHALWLSSSVLFLAVFWIGQELHFRMSPERRAILAVIPTSVRAPWEVIGACFWLPGTAALVAIILGVVPELEAALYFAALVLYLFMDAVMVLAVVTVGMASWSRAAEPDEPPSA